MVKGARLALVLALGGAALTPAGLRAQTVSLGLDALRDDIPATHLRWTVEGTAQPLSSLWLTLGFRDLDVDQDPFNGLPRIEESLQTGYAEVAALLGDGALTLRTALNRAEDDDTDVEYGVRGQYAVLFGSDPQAVTTFTLEAARERDVSVATAIAEEITYERIGGGLDLRVGERVSVSARVNRDRYSDDNRKTEAYAYGLLQIASEPAISFGYAFAFADSEVDNWQATGSTLDPATGIYEYHYFYFPYFTPVEEWGHSGLAVFQWSSEGGATVAASANIPVYSRGQRQAVPRWGVSPQPPPAHGSFTATDVLPLQARASASVPLLSWVVGTLRYEYFSKSFYSYQRGGVSLQFTF